MIPLHRENFSKKKLKCPLICAFDFETKGLGGEFIIGAATTSDAYRRLFYDIDEFFNFVISNPQYLYLAHNAVGYEFAYLYPLLYKCFLDNDHISILPTIQGDNRVVQFRIIIQEQTEQPTKPKSTKIDIRDTLCLFGMSLEQVAKAFCPELPKLKQNINFETETFDVNNQGHIDYVYRDCEIVLMAYQKLWSQSVELFDSPLGVTAGSSAMKAFKHSIDEGKVYYKLSETVDSFIRKCYYGGLVLPGKMVGDWGKTASADVNGAYAYQMKKHRYPIGTPTATIEYVEELVGFYHVIADVPDSVYDNVGFNPLPLRSEHGLCWPSGKFETFVSSPEIEYAIKCGCSIEVVCGYVFTRYEDVFSNFIDKCQEMEIYDNGVYKPTIKIDRNALYGKFGSKPGHKALCYSREQPDGDYIPLTNELTGEIVHGLYVGTEVSESDYMMPHWAALITAYERLYVMSFIEEAYRRGAKSVYCDTDSIKCDYNILMEMIEDGFIPIGKMYGQFKLEDICNEFIVIGSKCFVGELDDGGQIIKSKGVPKRVVVNNGGKQLYYDAILALDKPLPKKPLPSSQLEFENVLSVMKIIKENSNVRPVKRKRKITDIRNSFSWKLDGKYIYPLGYGLQ